MGASLVMVVCLFSGKRRAALVLAPLIFVLFGHLFIGRMLNPEFPSHHIIHLAGEKKYHIEGILLRPPEVVQEKTRVLFPNYENELSSLLVPATTRDKTRLCIRAERVYVEERAIPVVGNILLTVRDRKGDLRYGDRVRFISRLYLPRPATNPGAFDYRKFLALQGIWVTAFINSANEIVRMEEGEGNAFFHFVESGREKIRAFLDTNAPPRARGIIKALVLGERGEIDQTVDEQFIASGVNHILSISGLHVALVAAFFFGATRLFVKSSPFLLLRFNLNKISALGAVAPVIFYTFIAGLGVAAVRSTIMTLSFLLAVLLDREKDLYDALLLAAFLILIVTPAALFDISFQLSFLSVLGILYLLPRFLEYLSPFKPWLDGRPGWQRKIFLYLGGSLLTSAAAILSTGPLVVLYFNRISLVGFVANLFLVPLMGFANTLLSLLTALFVFVSGPLALLLTRLNVLILDISLALVDFFSRLPMASIRMATPPIPEIILAFGILIFGANLKRWRQAIYGFFLVVLVFAGFQFYAHYTFHHGTRLKVTFLDVGQGDAIVVQFPKGKIMVVDAGGTPDGSFDPGERIVAPFLWKEGIKEIDYLVNSHPHPDHLQGLLFLAEEFKIGQIWYSGEGEGEEGTDERLLSSEKGPPVQRMGRGHPQIDVSGAKVEFLHPPPEEGGQAFTGNNGSLAIRLTFGEVSFLLPGDVEQAAEEEILKTKAGLGSTVLKAPHHGSQTSSTPRLLEAVKPQIAVFTVRAGARQRLPHPAVLARYQSQGAKIYRTDRDGAITFLTDGKSLQVSTFLKPLSAEH